MAYSKTTWVNDTSPAISAANLNKIENGIETADVNATKAQSNLKNSFLNDFTLTAGKYIDYSSGAEYSSGGLNTTGFIPISIFSKYICFYGLSYNYDNPAGFAFYSREAVGGYISGKKLYNLSDREAIPNNTKFVRITIPDNCVSTYSISFIENAATLNSYIATTNNDIETLNETKLSVVTDNDCDFIEKSINLFDKATVTEGYYVDGATGELRENAYFWASDYILVEPSTTYTLRYKNQGSQYDANKNVIGTFCAGYSDTTSAESVTATTASNAKYVRICGANTQLTTDQFEKGDHFTSYVDYYKKIKPYLIPPISELTSKTLNDIIYRIYNGNNTKIKLVGDSITHGMGGTGYAQDGELIGQFFGQNYYRNPHGYCWANLFEAYLEEEFSCSVVNNGVSGTSWIELNNKFTTLVDDDDDIAICMYGTNNRDSAYFSNLSGIIQSCIDKFKAKNIDLIVMTCIPASVENEETHDHHIEEINHIIKKMCIRNDIVFVDTNQIMLDYCEYRNVQINSLLADGLHPNDDGYTVLYNAICKVLGITRKVTGATW